MAWLHSLVQYISNKVAKLMLRHLWDAVLLFDCNWIHWAFSLFLLCCLLPWHLPMFNWPFHQRLLLIWQFQYFMVKCSRSMSIRRSIKLSRPQLVVSSCLQQKKVKLWNAHLEVKAYQTVVSDLDHEPNRLEPLQSLLFHQMVQHHLFHLHWFHRDQQLFAIFKSWWVLLDSH